MNSTRSIAALLCVAALAACSKDAAPDITAPAAGASIKFYNFAVGAPVVNFYANDTLKLTAAASATGTESKTLGTAYGAVGNGGFYSEITPASYTFQGKMVASGADSARLISSVVAAVADGHNYSMYLSGFYNATTKTAESFLVEDAYPATVDYTQAYVRFVNAISNSSPMVLYAKNTTTSVETAVGGAVGYKAAGTFVTLPPAAYDLNTRTVGSATNAIARAGVSFVAGHVYTISARGDMTITSTTATNRPILDNTANR